MLRSCVLSMFKRVIAWPVDCAHAICGVCRERVLTTVHRHEMWNLRSRHHKRFVSESGWHDRRLFLQLHKEGMQSVGWVTAVLLAPMAWGQELDAAWFKANYLPAAEKLNKAYSECSAKVTERNTTDKSPNYNEIIRTFAFDGSQRKFERSVEDHADGQINAFTRAIVASPSVSFMVLTRKEQGQVLEYVNRSSMGFSKATARIDEEASDSIYSGFAFIGERVSDWFKHASFQFKTVQREGDKIKLDFLCMDADGRSYEGFVNFLPDRQWVISDWDITLKTSNPPYSWRNVTTVNYSGDEPVPNLAGIVDVGYHPDRVNTRKLTVEELKFAVPPANEFKLASYGYDDRVGQSPSALKALWLWLAGAGIICLLLAFAIRRRHAFHA